MGIPAPLQDTERLVDWDELPIQVRQLRTDFNPLAKGVLMAHQVEWIEMQRDLDIAVCEKGRRTGITFAQALTDTITAASSKEAGGDNCWYIADTREKGLEYIGYVAKFSQIVARGQATMVEQHIFVDQLEDGTSRNIQAFRVRFASGFRITALSSRPENIHGLQGLVSIDEAALHKDVAKVIESATALLIWGGRIRVWSSHRGKKTLSISSFKTCVRVAMASVPRPFASRSMMQSRMGSMSAFATCAEQFRLSRVNVTGTRRSARPMARARLPCVKS